MAMNECSLNCKHNVYMHVTNTVEIATTENVAYTYVCMTAEDVILAIGNVEHMDMHFLTAIIIVTNNYNFFTSNCMIFYRVLSHTQSCNTVYHYLVSKLYL